MVKDSRHIKNYFSGVTNLAEVILKYVNIYSNVLAPILIMILFLGGCKDSSTNSKSDFKNPNEMIWTADTLPVPEGAIQVLPEDLLVNSPTDIWLATWVGHGQVMHYDGSTWQMVKEIGGGIDCLVNANANGLWAGGYIGREVNGQFSPDILTANFSLSYWYDNSLSLKGEILDMCTDPNENIWACGRNGIILKYSNKKWNTDTLKVPHYNEGEYFLNSIAYYKDKIFVLARVIDSNKKIDLYYYATGDIGNWKIEDSVIVDQPFVPFKWGQWKLYSSGFGNLYSIGLNGIWKYNGESWNKIYSDHTYLYGIYGANENYLVAVGDYGDVLYYDGNNWQNILNLLKVGSTDFIFTNVWTNGSETFIAGYGAIDGVEKTIIWHGK